MTDRGRASPHPLDDDVLAVSEQLTPLPALKQAGMVQLDFDGELATPLKYYEDVRSGCGGQTWPAGMVLAKHMLRYHRHELEHYDTILELGAGGGLVGLAVALGCAGNARLLLTDQEEMLGLMRYNICDNGLQSRATALVLNWGQALPQAVVQQRPSIILAAECVYFEPAFPLLMQTLKDLLALNSQAVVYFCFKKRRRADLHFVKAAKKTFIVDEPLDHDRPVFARQALFLYSLRAKAATVTNATTNAATNATDDGDAAAAAS